MTTSLAFAERRVNGFVRPVFPAKPFTKLYDKLAIEIGDKPAIILAMIDYLLTYRGVVRSGALRVRLTVDDIQKKRGWSERTIRRVLKKMIDDGLLTAIQRNSVDRSRWFAFGPAVADLEHFTPSTPLVMQVSSPSGHKVDADEPEAGTDSPAASGHDVRMATQDLNLVQETLDQVKDQDSALTREPSHDDGGDSQLLENLKAGMVGMVSPMNHQTYIAKIARAERRGGKILLIAESGFVANWLRLRCESTIRRVLVDLNEPGDGDVEIRTG